MPKKKEKKRKTNKTTHKVWKDKRQGIDSGYLRVLQFFFSWKEAWKYSQIPKSKS